MSSMRYSPDSEVWDSLQAMLVRKTREGAGRARINASLCASLVGEDQAARDNLRAAAGLTFKDSKMSDEKL
jgi:hypothetical protein